MDISLINSNLCCNALLKISFWLILAKYKTSKLEVIKRVTEDAALNEFESRMFLRKNCFSYSGQNQFFNFIRNVYDVTAILISNYICNPEWYIFRDDGNNSMKQLKSVMQNELFTTLPVFNSGSHPQCYHVYHTIREEIFSIISTWPDIEYLYSNYISAQLSDIFAEKVKLIFSKYENFPYNSELRWLCDDIMREECATRGGQRCSGEKNAFWFFSQTLDEDAYLPESQLANAADPVRTLADRLFNESVAELKARAKILVENQNRNEYSTNNDMWTLHKEQLSTLLNVPIVNLELHLTLSSANALLVNFNVSEGPHYYMPGSSITVLQPALTTKDEKQSVTAVEAFEKPVTIPAPAGPASGDAAGDITPPVVEVNHQFVDESTLFGPIDAILDGFQDSRDDEYGCKLTDIKSELEEFCDDKLQNTESGRFFEPWKAVVKAPVPKLLIRSRQEAKQQKAYDPYPNAQHKRRGRPRKIDNFAETVPKTTQHKYSVEDVRDCSIWISENFYEVTGNKPAIDRARMYELYTNYCTLKLCTPVDRALFGKIIRKVFPQLKSRRLIQNQVLKYHYVGLKPRYSELERALSFTDASSMNPNHILLTYVTPE